MLSLRRASQEIERMKDDAKNSMKLGTDALGSENQVSDPSCFPGCDDALLHDQTV